jgi:hypothetical protein
MKAFFTTPKQHKILVLLSKLWKGSGCPLKARLIVVFHVPIRNIDAKATPIVEEMTQESPSKMESNSPLNATNANKTKLQTFCLLDPIKQWMAKR